LVAAFSFLPANAFTYARVQNLFSFRPTQLLNLLTMNINELGEIKKDFPDLQSEKSSKVTLIANLSNQLFQDLANLYELQPFVKVTTFQPLKLPASNSLRVAV